MNLTEQFLRAASAKPSTEMADEWIEKNVVMVDGEQAGSHPRFRWFKQQSFILRNYQNERTRKITAMVATQCGKTWCAIFCLIWAIVNRPRTSGWFTDTAESQKIDYRAKLIPAFEGCGALEEFMPTRREQKSQQLIQFTTMNLFVLGARSKRNRERLTIPEIFIDEARNLQPGALQEIEGRFKTITNFKRFMFSTAGKVFYNENGDPIGDELFVAYWRGSRHQLFWTCPHCQCSQTFRFGKVRSPLYPDPKGRERGGFVWEINADTMPKDDTFNFDALFKTIRYECEGCGQHFIEADKFALLDSIEVRQTNPMAASGDVSIHWWEAYMRWGSWNEIVKKFLLATIAMKRGDLEPMRVFINDTLGEPWEEILGDKLSESDLLTTCGEYSVGEEYPKDIKSAKILTVDNQHGFIVFTYEVFALSGDARLVDCGSLATFDELRAYQVAKGIKDAGVGIDCAYMPDDVFNACLRYGRWLTPAGMPAQQLVTDSIWNGWMPMLGDDAEEFGQRLAGVSVRCFNSFKVINANTGRAGAPRFVPRLSFSKSHYRDLLYSYALKGKLGTYEWPKNILAYNHDFVKQVSNVWKAPVVDARGQVIGQEFRERGRHDFSDCLVMGRVLGDFRGIRSAIQSSP